METTRKPYTVKCEGISRRYYYAHVTGDAPTIAANTALLEVQARARREGQEPDELAVVAIREGTLPEDEMRSAGVMSAEAALCRLALVTQKLIHAIDKPLAVRDSIVREATAALAEIEAETSPVQLCRLNSDPY